MPAVLTQHSYGKSRIRLTKVTRLADRHEVRELTIEIELEGEFADSYTSGDNRLVIPTDTMKNVAYALAREHPLESIEDFGAAVAGHFLDHHPHVEQATVRLAEQPLERIRVDGREHPHAFCGRTRETRTSTVRGSRARPARRVGPRRPVPAQIDRLGLLRVSCAIATRRCPTPPIGSWPRCSRPTGCTTAGASRLERAHARIRQALLETFAGHQSLSVQQTLHAMGAAALEACPEIERITLVMPNQHRILVDLKPFGLENANEVFLATDEPHGTITGTLQRA